MNRAAQVELLDNRSEIVGVVVKVVPRRVPSVVVMNAFAMPVYSNG